jgi:hypothetical protein
MKAVSVHSVGRWFGAASAVRVPGRAQIEQETRQYRRMVAAGFLILLVPAAIASMTGWRWRPWPPGPDGYRSFVSEAKEAAQTYILFAFVGW